MLRLKSTFQSVHFSESFLAKIFRLNPDSSALKRSSKLYHLINNFQCSKLIHFSLPINYVRNDCTCFGTISKLDIWGNEKIQIYSGNEICGFTLQWTWRKLLCFHYNWSQEMFVLLKSNNIGSGTDITNLPILHKITIVMCSYINSSNIK